MVDIIIELLKMQRSECQAEKWNTAERKHIAQNEEGGWHQVTTVSFYDFSKKKDILACY